MAFPIQHNDQQRSSGINLSADLPSLEEIETTVKNTELFWAKFCEIFAKNKGSDDYFQITMSHSLPLIKGADHITFEMKKEIELFRKFALEAFETYCSAHRILIRIETDLFLQKPSEEGIINQDALKAESQLSRFFLKVMLAHTFTIFLTL